MRFLLLFRVCRATKKVEKHWFTVKIMKKTSQLLYALYCQYPTNLAALIEKLTSQLHISYYFAEFEDVMAIIMLVSGKEIEYLPIVVFVLV